MKILRFVAQVWRERARSIAFSGTVSFFAWPLCALAVSIAQLHSHTLTVLLSSILAGVTGALASFARERHLANLEVQFRNVEELKPVNWDVVVNGVKTGEVSNADYAAIQYEVYASNWLWLQQAVSILKAVWRSATSTVSALPFCPDVGVGPWRSLCAKRSSVGLLSPWARNCGANHQRSTNAGGVLAGSRYGDVRRAVADWGALELGKRFRFCNRTEAAPAHGHKCGGERHCRALC